jgi:hypothetical protein
VDGYLDRPELVSDLRRELGQYLERHAVPGSHEKIADAELIASEAVSNAIRHAAGPVWVSLGWSTELPVPRHTTASHEPPRHRASLLPALEEARPEGGFDKASFPRAIVVQLSQALETNHGPEAAEAAVAQVGTDVGGRMEEEFRAARGVVGRR